MIRRLGMVIHWFGFGLGVLAFLFALASAVSGLFDAVERSEKNLARMQLEGLQMIWDERRESELTEKGKEMLDAALENGLINDFKRAILDQGGNPIVRREDEATVVSRITGTYGSERFVSIADISFFDALAKTEWYLYLLGLVLSPSLVLLTMLPFWAVQFILTGNKSLAPWKGHD